MTESRCPPSVPASRAPASQDADRADSRSPTAAACAAIFLWCWSAVCMAKGGRLMGQMALLALTAGVGTATAVLLQACRRRPLRDLVRLPAKALAAGFIGIACYSVILFWALGMANDADVGQVALLNYLWPIWTVLFSIVLLEKTARPWPTIAGAVLGFAGVVVARGPAAFLTPPSSLLPHGLALLGGILWALYCVSLKRWRIPEGQGGPALHFAECTVMAAVAAAFMGEWRSFPTLTPEMIGWVLFAGIGPIGLGYTLWEIGVKKGNLQLLSLLAYFIPVGAAILIAIFFRASCSWGLIPGALMIALGAWLATRANAKPTTKDNR